MTNTGDTKGCTMCGTCCIKGGATLHSEDLPLIREGVFDLTDLVTLRKGEMAHDPVQGILVPLEEEIIKLRGRDRSWTCTFYEPESRACTIYDNRPAECRVLDCNDTAPLAEMYDVDRINRADLLPEGHPLLELAAEHEEKCPPRELTRLGSAAKADDVDAYRALIEMVTYDREIRRLATERGNLPEESLDFFLGRSMEALLATVGIRVRSGAQGLKLVFRGK
ncbi:YkgJ family cysteine cluster protein [Salidesulfovibrio brasiliensis]|uniref:YkgJ family cysteine cluster protein n=1 Tax=Salidesulfovibrio brasiliensis TaxID=221711 RepID=UPI0006D155D1|nr:YkgJ family cysteine cluster protein [Salidesulfovibrio brasiliensis]